MANELTIQDINGLAKQVCAGRLFPAFDTPEKLATLMMLCQAEGVHPITAVRRYDIIQGRPAMKSDAMLGDFQARGGKVAWVEYSETAVTGEFSAPGLASPVRVSWTMEMAKRAGLADKGPWKQFPRAMLKARVISEGIRISMPAIISGIYTPEEVQDFAPAAMLPAPQAQSAPQEPEPIDVQPENKITPAQLKAVQAIATEQKIGDGLTPMEKRAARIAWLNSQISRTVGSTSDLTESEASKIIDAARTGS